MYEEAVRVDLRSLGDVPDHFKTQEMCKRVVKENPVLKYVPDRFTTQKMCDEAVSHGTSSLQYVPDYFVTQQQVKLWYNYDDYINELIKWYNVYQKRKAQKAQIKEELMPIAWHPSRWWNWCVPEDKKKGTENFFEKGP